MKITYKVWSVKELEGAALPPVSDEKPVEVKKKRPVPEVSELPKQSVVSENVEPVAIKKSYTKKPPKKPENENQKPVHVNHDIVELPNYKPQIEVVPEPKPVSQPVSQPEKPVIQIEKPVIQIEKPVIQIEKQEIIELPPAPTAIEEKTPVVVSDVKYKKKSFDLFPEIKEVRRKYEPLVKIEAPKFTSEKKHRTLYKQRF